MKYTGKKTQKWQPQLPEVWSRKRSPKAKGHGINFRVTKYSNLESNENNCIHFVWPLLQVLFPGSCPNFPVSIRWNKLFPPPVGFGQCLIKATQSTLRRLLILFSAAYTRMGVAQSIGAWVVSQGTHTYFDVLILLPNTFLNVFVRVREFLVVSLGSFVYRITSSENRDTLTSYFPACIPFISFFCLTAGMRLQVPCRTAENWHPSCSWF